MSAVIETSNLRKSFGSFVAVDGISLSVQPGECFGLLGPNGAGKTTTIRMLYGFTPRDSGSLRLFDTDCDGAWRQLKGRIGICQQDNNLDPDLTVRENLEVFAAYFNLPQAVVRQRVASLLQFISLEGREQAGVRDLSGGMMRRLVLARALINEPQLLILDEPTTGLDPQSRHQLWSRLDELKARGLTTLLTTHYMDEAQRLCDRLVIMDQGKILVEGAPRDLIRQHVGDSVIEVVAACEGLRRMILERGLPHEDLGQRLVIYSGNGEALYRELLAEHCREGCMLRPATLEDVFLRLTGRELRE
ncbi:ATP-binding cassette domain-containing protein [Trichlorobacter sp.]|uniref:ATP-binding cassette domain-containing protein n=1 Tax=Trichlorobacter sp. TaxID=2911007 RepID=UPI002A36AE96|nr:ATP-binding cassette domain-containing protein [Trichlorobacter sp.]MDY0383386.1 ATP-binding cassette domain-containing protein [Trichlorobacter sp.]